MQVKKKKQRVQLYIKRKMHWSSQTNIDSYFDNKRQHVTASFSFILKQKWPVSILSVYHPAGSSVHGISQARKLQWVAVSSSRRSSPPDNPFHCRQSPALQVDSLPTQPPGKPLVWYGRWSINVNNFYYVFTYLSFV